MAVATAADFVATLRRLPLLTPEQTAQLPALAQRFPDIKALGGELIRRGWLTPSQANQLLQAGGQGLVLGAYVLLERLGEGGMGQVFKARHQHLDRIVALKLIHKERLNQPQAVQQFLARLNQQTKEDGWTYRLPSEAEWEYACRGGPSCTPSNAGFDYYFEMPTNQLAPDLANYRYDRSVNRTCKVGSYAANPLGLHDMHGNVWEWCDDEFKTPDGPRRVCRGGGWVHEAGRCRAVDRALIAPTYSRNDLGLRVARVPVGKESK